MIVDEIERKYDVGADAALDLSGLPGVASVSEPVRMKLDATYLDTADLRLAARGLTLRRRTGGNDAGWHLKLPAGKDTRREVRAPLGRSARTVPATLSKLVPAFVRGSELAPVARIATVRVERELRDEAGAVLGSVTSDTVTATRLGGRLEKQAWHEVEVELVGGSTDLLDAVEQRVLAAGGAPAASSSKLRALLADQVRPPFTEVAVGKDATAGDVLTGHLQAQVLQLLRQDPQVRLDREEAVHAMRVATRRLRSALRTFRPLLDASVTRPIGDELRWLAGELGTVRDAQVLHARLQAAVKRLPAEQVLGPVAARLQTDVLAPSLRAQEDLVATLTGERYLALLDTLDRLCANPPLQAAAAGRAADVLPALLNRARNEVRQRLAAARRSEGSTKETELHEARKAAKRLRYAGEALAPALGGAPGRGAGSLAAAAEEVQEALGDVQDGLVAREALRAMALRAAAAGESAYTYGLLVGVELQRADLVDARALRRLLR